MPDPVSGGASAPPSPIRLDGCSLKIMDVVHFARDRYPLEIDPAVWERVARGRAVVEQQLASGAPAYGVNTGVGSQKSWTVSPEQIPSFNRRVLVAHATVASEAKLPPMAVRAALLVQLNQLVSGVSGVRPELVRALHQRLAGGEVPVANTGASVGASDLVPLAQMALSLLGVANPLDAAAAFVEPALRLEAKEALALMNSNAVSLGEGALALLQARKLLRGFDLTLAFALEGLRGNPSIVDPAVHAVRPQAGQRTASSHLARLLDGSALLARPGSLQDPLSFRCGPQVHGACYDTLRWIWRSWEVELNSVQDNPLVDLKHERLVCNGNMDGTLLTVGTDALRAALATAVDISAQRMHKLHWPAFSGLPSGLTSAGSALGGVQFLNLSHIAEAYAAAVRGHARPAALNYQGQLADGVEDHATLLPMAVTATHHLLEAAWVVQALELTVACWAIRRRGIEPAALGAGLRAVYQQIAPHLPIGREGDEVFDVRPVVELVRDGEIVDLIDEAAPPFPDFRPVDADVRHAEGDG